MHGDVRKLTFDEVFFSIARDLGQAENRPPRTLRSAAMISAPMASRVVRFGKSPPAFTSAKIKNFGEKVGVWKGLGCGLIAALGRECCFWFRVRLPEAG
jgi:hypothetical protein